MLTNDLDSAPLTVEATIRLKAGYTERAGVILSNYNGSAPSYITFEIFENGNPSITMVDKNGTISSRNDIGYEAYVFLGEMGVYVYQVVSDYKANTTTAPTENAAIELYFTLGTDALTEKTYGLIIYYNNTSTPIKAYYYDVANNKMLRSEAKYSGYYNYQKQLLEITSSYAKIAYEVFIDYSMFGLNAAPENMGIYVVARQSGNGAISNNTSTSVETTNIANYLTYDKNGLVAATE